MIINEVFSKRQSIVTYTLNELSALINNGQVKLRQVNKLHVRAIKRYILENVLTEQIYFPPLVANVAYLGTEKPQELTIIDGSQRLAAFCQIEETGYRVAKSDHHEEMKKGYKLIHFAQHTEVAIQIFEGLSQEESDQLYIDLNTKGKKVALSKRIAFDSRKELNIITNTILKMNTQLKTAGVEIEKRAVIRPANKKLLSLSHLRQIVAIFLTGRMVFRTIEERYEPHLRAEDYVQLINTWFHELFRLYSPEKIGNFQISMLANHPLLVSVAYFANKGLGKKGLEEREQELFKRMRRLKDVDFNRQNPIWKEFRGTARAGYYYLANDKGNIEKLVNWLEEQGGE
ncbi:DNA sulfur modification protein DndB [Cytobacillus sp. Hz8]|uniref:DNA sulfur modification protein DndB n=1 Tax=Cytobacillus sp. Hz8 TaxID=3347168 RepID=UPI0035E1E15F